MIRIKINDKYKQLHNNTRYYIITGGRGSGKSFAASLLLCADMATQYNHRILYTRYTMTSAHLSIIPEFSEKLNMLNVADFFDINKTEITHNFNNSQILFRGIKTSSGNQTAALKSLHKMSTWVVDEAEELPDEETFDDIDLSIRSREQRNRVIIILNPTHKQHWIYKRFFENRVPDNYTGVKDNITYIHTTYLDNINNLPKSYINTIEHIKQTNYNKYTHEILGAWIHDIDGALWKYSLIQKNRVEIVPEFKRVVVAIDPAVTANKDSDETGIIVAGIDNKDIAYVIKDYSGKYTPDEWARKAVYVYEKYMADKIIGEVNNGGDLIEANIRQYNKGINYKEVRAYKGKYLRAEPVSGLYEQGKVKHVGTHVKLEEQMTTWNASDGQKSPDRLDALVYAITDLLLNKQLNTTV